MNHSLMGAKRQKSDNSKPGSSEDTPSTLAGSRRTSPAPPNPPSPNGMPLSPKSGSFAEPSQPPSHFEATASSYQPVHFGNHNEMQGIPPPISLGPAQPRTAYPPVPLVDPTNHANVSQPPMQISPMGWAPTQNVPPPNFRLDFQASPSTEFMPNSQMPPRQMGYTNGNAEHYPQRLPGQPSLQMGRGQGAQGPMSAVEHKFGPAHSPVSDSSSSRPSARQLGKVYAAPIERPRSLDDVAPRATFLSIISLYFHHLYPLMPIVHQPTFSHDLITRRDERDSDFLSFVLSLTAYTLIQCPRSVIPAPWPFYRKMHKLCHQTSRKMQLERHVTSDPPTLTQCATLYTTHIYMGSTGRTFAANAIHGELVRTAFSINLHDETRPLPTGAGMPSNSDKGPPRLTEIERQLRRRVYYLIYGSDKTISILSDEPISLRDADTVGVEIPAAVDDDLIFPHKVGEQPPERGPSILCGFETVSKLHRVMSDLVERYRSDRMRPPTSIEVTRAKLRYASSILKQIQDIVAEMPEVLRKPSFEHTEPPPRPPGDLPDLGQPSFPSAGAGLNSMNGPMTTLAASTRNLGLQTMPFVPWPHGTFDENGLPNATDGSSQPSSSAASPSAWGGPPLATGPAPVPGAFFSDFMPSNNATGSRSGSPVPPSAAQLNAARDQVVAFRPSPPATGPSQTPILSGFAICRANILVTEAMLRFLLVDYRELLKNRLDYLRKEAMATFSLGESSGNGMGLGQPDSKMAMGLAQELQMGNAGSDADEDVEASNDIEVAAQNFFSDAVASLPFDALAANGQSLILKLVFIVSNLLNRTSVCSRAYAYMTEFLRTLSQLSDRRSAGDDEPDSDDEI